MSTQPGPLTGKYLGKYQVLDRIGYGGMAEVYHGRHERLNREVAIKVLHPALRDDPELLARFEREAHLVAKLRHSNIVQMYDFDTQVDQMYMVMEYISGGTLKQRLEELQAAGTFMPLSEISRLLDQMVSALDYAHTQKMLHRDLKPSNLLLDSAGNIFLTDFGIAHLLGGARITSTGSLLGTPAYMSPEQGQGQHLSNGSDLYSLSVILFELITGKVPYEADTPIGILHKIVSDPIPSVAKYRQDVPANIQIFFDKALAKKPEDRFQTGAELAADFSKFLPAAGVYPQGTPPLNPANSRVIANRKTYQPGVFPNKWIIALMILLIGLIAGGLALWAARRATVNTLTRCTTPATCQAVAEKLVEAKRYSLASDALSKAVSLVSPEQQVEWARLKCDQGDVFMQLRNRVSARNAYQECIIWTHNTPQSRPIRDYAQQKLSTLN